jgi:Flp pilus assembly protein TadD
MNARRVIQWVFALTLVGAASLGAQGRAGMPDMSNAPADVQAIWKKVMSGGIPTQDEAKKLGDYMAANKGAIAKNATAYGDSMKKQSVVAKAALLGSDQPACPTRAPLSPSLSKQPTSKIAMALLDSIRQAYSAKLKPQSLSILNSALGKVSDPAALNQLGVALLLKGYNDLAILTHVAEVQRAPSVGAQGAWADLGAALLVVGDALPAVPVLRYALGLGTRNPTYVTDLGVAYADLGDLTTATTFLQEAIRLDPKAGQAYDALGRVASCQGNTTLAAASMQKAQDDDWDKDRQKSIDKADANSQKADDDATEAAKDLPEPPGRSPFPPPPGGGRPSNFLAYSPKIPADYHEAQAASRYNLSMISSYQDLIRQMLGSVNKPNAARTSSARSSSAALVVRYSISNGDQAIAGATEVKRIEAAKVKLAHRVWNEKYQSIIQEAMQRTGPVDIAYRKCDSKKQDCFRIYCQQMRPIVVQEYAALAGNTTTFIGELAGFSEGFSKTMNHWFFWAGDPESRKVIDLQRRYYLADFQVEAFTAASTTVTGLPDGCEQKLAEKPPGKGTIDDAEDPGPCTSRSIKLPFFATMQADCHEMTMSIDFPPIAALMGGSPTLDIRRSSDDKYGKFFIGVSNDIADGAASYSAGMQVTWDQGGWVKGAGPALTASAEDLNGIVHVSGELMANGLSNGGPTLQGSLSGSVPSLGVAPSVSFGGKY